MTFTLTAIGIGLLAGTCLIGGALMALIVVLGGRSMAGRGEMAIVPDEATPELAAQIDDRLPHRTPDRDSDLPSRAELQRWAQVDLDTSGDWDAALRNLTGGSS